MPRSCTRSHATIFRIATSLIATSTGSAGIVKVLDGQSRSGDTRRYPDMRWEPKAAFDALTEIYTLATSTGALRLADR